MISTLEQAQSLIGTRVCVGEVCGILTFVGPNKVLEWDLQVTVARVPIQIKSLNEIKIWEK
jgi:hypothetical protein